jgi:hypothetical protein
MKIDISLQKTRKNRKKKIRKKKIPATPSKPGNAAGNARWNAGTGRR